MKPLYKILPPCQALCATAVLQSVFLRWFLVSFVVFHHFSLNLYKKTLIINISKPGKKPGNILCPVPFYCAFGRLSVLFWPSRRRASPRLPPHPQPTTRGTHMKKNIGFGLLVFFALLICFLFAQQAAYHVVSIFLIVPSVVAVIFYRRRGLVYAALILLAALMIPVFINKDPLAIAESSNEMSMKKF